MKTKLLKEAYRLMKVCGKTEVGTLDGQVEATLALAYIEMAKMVDNLWDNNSISRTSGIDGENQPIFSATDSLKEIFGEDYKE